MKRESVEKGIGKIVLPSVKNIIVIASGKGGVGKSMVAANLAIALSKTGAKTAVVDADIYGPSISKMFNIKGLKAKGCHSDGGSSKKPILKYGVKLLSVGFLMENQKTVPWTGNTAASKLIRLISETDWGEIDYMIIDLPPEVRDIHMAIVQKLNISGAILITTPQSVALFDVFKAAKIFLDNSINIPILGIIENMSYLLSKETPLQKRYIFGKGGGEILAEQLGVPLLGQIPISQEICESGEIGDPLAHADHGFMANIFDLIARNVIRQTPSFHEFYY